MTQSEKSRIIILGGAGIVTALLAVSYTHLRAHET